MRATWASSYRWVLAGLVVLCGLNFARPAPTADVKVALVIGNSHYKRANLALPNAVNDAKDIADALTKDGFTVTTKYDLTKDDFEAALSDFAIASQSADISLFYFAGHGVQYRGQNYLLPTDNTPNNNQDIRFKSVAMKDVVDAASDARRAKIIILDACRNNKPDPGNPGSRSVTGVGDATGLAAIDGSHGLAVFYSAQHGKAAQDAGPFAASLAKHIVEPGVDIKAVFTAVEHDVLVGTNKGQEPETVTASLDEPIILSPEETPEEAWAKIRKSEDSAVLKDFIKRFPNAGEADDAQTRLDYIDKVRRDKERDAEEAKRAAAQEEAKKQLEQREAAREEVERQRKAKEEAEKAARDKQLADQQAAAAVFAEQLRKADEDRKRIAAQVEAERAKREQAEAEAKQKEEEAAKAEEEAAAAKKLAEQQNDARQRDAKQRDADQKAREAQAAADEASRAQAEIARRKAEDDARRQQALLDDEARQASIAKMTADACAKDLAQLEKYKQARQMDLIQSLRGQSICPTFAAAADQATKDVDAALAKTCDAEQKSLAAIDVNNEAALNSALGRFSCDAVRKKADAELAKLEADKQRMVVTCADERAATNAIDPATPAAKRELLALRAKAACRETPNAIDQIVSGIDERVTSAQGDLIRLACLDKASGEFDEATANALAKYLQARKAPAETPRITQGLVDELSDQDWKVCAPPQVASTGTDATKPATTRTGPMANEHATAPVERPRPRIAAPPSVKLQQKHFASYLGASARSANRPPQAPVEHSSPIDLGVIPGD